jgi:phenylacetate-CoA ligase
VTDKPGGGLGGRLGGTAAVLRLARGQRRVPYLPQDRIRELRDARVRETVAYAAQTVPYYNDLFRTEGIDPREIRAAEDLERLPVLSKAELRADPARFLSVSPRASGAVVYTTRGTTGLRVTIWHDRRSLLENIAYGERERGVTARFAGKRVRYTGLSISLPDGAASRTRAYTRKATLIPLRPTRRRFSMLDPLEGAIAEVNRVRPDVIGGFGSYLELLFHTVVARGIDMHLPKVVVYRSDLMTPAGRRLIEGELGVPVISHYNAVEAFKIGFFCEERGGFHLHEDLCHVRVVGQDGRTQPDGERGEVVISNLVNRGTVLLNYNLGDLASVRDGPCPCGRMSRVLSELEGRSSEVLHLPDGSYVHPEAVYKVVTAKEELIVKYQLVQVEPERYELKLVTASRDVYDRVIDEILVGLHELLRGAAVDATYHEIEASQELAKLKRVVALPHAGVGA